MARTMPISKGWTTLVPSDGTILPGADATMSTYARDAHRSAKQISAMIVAATPLPTGDAGVSTISSAAGRNAVSSALERALVFGNEMILLADFMDARLKPVERGVTATGTNQLVVGSVLDDAAAFDGDDAVRAPDGGKPV